MPPIPMPSIPSAPQDAVWLSAPMSSMPGFAMSSAYSVWQMPLPARAKRRPKALAQLFTKAWSPAVCAWAPTRLWSVNTTGTSTPAQRMPMVS